MPRKRSLLKPKQITAIAFCDRGANPEAHITIFKRDAAADTPGTIRKRIVERDGQFCVVSHDGDETFGCHETREKAEAQLAALEANKTAAPTGVVRRVIAGIGKALGWTAEQIQKAWDEATTFGEMQDERKLDAVIAEANRAGWDLIDAISRTLRDDDAENKGALIRTSLAQFSNYVENALPMWLQGETLEKGDVPVAKLEAARDALSTLIDTMRETPDDGTITTTPPEATMPDVTKTTDQQQATEPGAAPAGGAGQGGGQDAANLDDVLKGLTPEARAAVLELKKAADAAAQRAEEAEKVAKAERDARQLAEIRKMVEDELGALPNVKAETLAPVIKAAREKLSAEEWEAIETVLKAADAAIRQGNLFVVRGSDGGSSDAYGKLLAKAEEIRKAEPTLTREQAVDKAMLQNPDLAEAYRREKGFGKAAAAR